MAPMEKSLLFVNAQPTMQAQRSRAFYRLQSRLFEQNIGKSTAIFGSSSPFVRRKTIPLRHPFASRPEPVCRFLTTVSLSETCQQADQVQLLSEWTRRRPITENTVDKSKELLPGILADDALPVADRLALLNHTLDFWKIALDRLAKKDRRRSNDMLEPEQICSWIQTQWIRGQVLDEHHEALQTTFCNLLSVMAQTRPSDANNKQLVHQVLDSMPIAPSLVVWNAALTVLAKWREASAAWDLFQKMKQEPDLVPNIISYSCVLEALVHEQAYGFAVLKAHGLLHEMIKSPETMPNSICYFHYLRILIADNQLDVALKTLQELASSFLNNPLTAVAPNQYLFAAVMTASAKQREWQRTTELLQLLQTLYQTSGSTEFLLQPKSLTNELNAVFYSDSDKRAVARTMSTILEQCRQLALEANEPTCLPQTNHYNKTMEAWASAIAPNNRDALREVEELMRQMSSSDQQSSKPNKLSYTTLMKSLARSKYPQAAKQCQEILNDMWKVHERFPWRNTKPDALVYNIAILSCSHAARRDADAPLQADALYKDMIRRVDAGDESLEPTEATYVAIMTAWNHSVARASPRDKRRSAGRCRFYFDQARTRQQLGKKTLLSAKVYTALIDSLKEIGNAEQADIVFQHMIDDAKAGNSEAVPTMATFHTLMTAWARSRSADAPLRAEALLDRMKELNDEGLSFEPEVMTYNIILNCWAKSGREEAPERAEEIVRNMEEKCMSEENETKRLRPDTTTHGTVLEAWSRSRLPHAPSRALAYLTRLEERYHAGEENWRPTQFHFATVMNAFAAVGDTSAVEGLMKRMESAGIEPNTYCYNALIKAIVRSQVADAGIRSDEVLRAMIQSGAGQARPDVATYTSCITAWEQSPTKEIGLIRADSLVSQCIVRATPNAALFLAYLRLLNKCDGVDKAQKANAALKQMRDLGIPPTKHILQEVKECRMESPAVS